MRRKTVTIPSAFQPLDTAVTAADTFVNVRDIQVARLNHNILLAKRVGNTLFSRNFTSVDDAGTNLLYTTITVLKSTREMGSEIMRCQVLVPFYTKQLRLRLRACKSALSEGSELASNPIVTAEVWNQSARKVKQAGPSATISAVNGTPTDYTIDINVPPVVPDSGLTAGKHVFEFGLWVRCYLDHTQSLAAAVALQGVESNTLRVASAVGTARRVAFFDSDMGMEPRTIVKQNILAAGSFQMFLDKPMSRVPDVTSDTVDIREILGIDLYSATLRCLPIADFDQEFSL